MPSRPINALQPLSRPVAVDLFAGAGGLSLGLEQAGFDIGAAVEQAIRPVETHRRNFPNTPVIAKDIATVRASHVREVMKQGFAARGLLWDGTVTLCAGGPPCQGYSDGGHRRADDERNELVHQFRRLVVKLGSRYFAMENVPGILRPANQKNLEKLIAAFKRAGYHVPKPLALDASQLGLPQSRSRVLLIGWKKDVDAVDIEALKQRRGESTAAQEAIGDLPEIEGIDSLLETDTFVTAFGAQASSEYALAMRNVASGFAYPRHWDGRTLTGCARTAHEEAVVRRFAATAPGKSEPISRYRRLEAHGLAPTLRAGTGPEHGSHPPTRPIHYATPRVISVREAARLQSFPDWFRFADTKWHAWQEIGNSVPPMLARAVGDVIVAALGIAPLNPIVDAAPRLSNGATPGLVRG